MRLFKEELEIDTEENTSNLSQKKIYAFKPERLSKAEKYREQQGTLQNRGVLRKGGNTSKNHGVANVRIKFK